MLASLLRSAGVARMGAAGAAGAAQAVVCPAGAVRRWASDEPAGSSSDDVPVELTIHTGDAPPHPMERTMEGLNVIAGKEDPPLLPDSEYPDWLWELSPDKADYTEADGSKYFRQTRRRAIKAHNVDQQYSK